MNVTTAEPGWLRTTSAAGALGALRSGESSRSRKSESCTSGHAPEWP